MQSELRGSHFETADLSQVGLRNILQLLPTVGASKNEHGNGNDTDHPANGYEQVKVTADSHTGDSAWVGGSMLASLSTFNFMKIRKQEYDDSHAVIVHKKCL